MYQLYYFSDWSRFLKIPQREFTDLVRNFDWHRGIPGGWLKYAPPRAVTAYGDGSRYTDEGHAMNKLYNYTAWRASTPASYCTSVVKTAPLPKTFIRSGILKAMRHFLRINGVWVDNTTCTGMWCNYYSKPGDNIAGHTDDEDYYARNYKEDTVFVSLTLFEDELFDEMEVARFQIRKDNQWTDLKLPHLSLLVMSGACEHRVLKPFQKNFRPRYNITFRTPVKFEMDVLKNFRFFSNFGRYYRITDTLYVPPDVFINPPLTSKTLIYKGLLTAKDKQGNKYKLKTSDNYSYQVIKYYSDFGEIKLKLNSNLSRKEVLDKLEFKSAPVTTTTEALLVLSKELKNK